MKNRKLIIISICSALLLAALLGFFIAFDVSPQIAFARIFIDVGVTIGLIALLMGLLKEEPLITGNIVHALRALEKGKYQTRISLDEQDPLIEIGRAINKLAQVLEKEKSAQEKIRQNLREELLPALKKNKDISPTEHSFHPELGPVQAIPDSKNSLVDSARDSDKSAKLYQPQKIPTKPPVVGEMELNNTLVISKPPAEEKKKNDNNTKIVEELEQDLGELYQNFIDAQRQNNISQVEYPEFLQTVEQARKELLKTHECSRVNFLVVNEKDQVALQPKIYRE